MPDNLTPQNDAERGIHQALSLLIRSQDIDPVSTSDFLALCRRSPDYAKRLIDAWRLNWISNASTDSQRSAATVRTVEWELLGASAIIARRGNFTGDSDFIRLRLTYNPDDFTDDDLEKLIPQYKPGHAIHDTALSIQKRRVKSLADRLAAEPPGLSADIATLRKRITDYGFSSDLNEAMQRIDEELGKSGDPFDIKAMMGLIRGFFEKLHTHICSELRSRRPNVGNGTPVEKLGQAIEYLERKDVITGKLRALAKSLYDILSDDHFGAHAIKATRDYTRLCRNMVVEYAVVLFFELERRLQQPGDA